MSEVLLGKDVFSVLHYSKTHWPLAWTQRCNNPRKRTYNAKLVSVFQNSKLLAPKAK
jgi:hypothetical protein